MTVDLKRLKAERIANGLTQDDMAKRMGWKDRAAYAKRENGIVSIGANELAKMVTLLGFSQDKIWIFFKTDVPEKERNERKEV